MPKIIYSHNTDASVKANNWFCPFGVRILIGLIVLIIIIIIIICLSVFVKTWLIGFRLANLVSKKVGGLPSWSILLDSPGNALTLGGWIRLGVRVKTSGVGRGLF